MDYYCKYCGLWSYDLQVMTRKPCKNSPTGHHVPYEGGKQSSYTCKYCGFEYNDLQVFTNRRCSNSPNGHHVPL